MDRKTDFPGVALVTGGASGVYTSDPQRVSLAEFKGAVAVRESLCDAFHMDSLL